MLLYNKDFLSDIIYEELVLLPKWAHFCWKVHFFMSSVWQVQKQNSSSFPRLVLSSREAVRQWHALHTARATTSLVAATVWQVPWWNELRSCWQWWQIFLFGWEYRHYHWFQLSRVDEVQLWTLHRNLGWLLNNFVLKRRFIPWQSYHHHKTFQREFVLLDDLKMWDHLCFF